MKKPKFGKGRAPTCDILAAKNDGIWTLAGLIFTKSGVIHSVEVKNMRSMELVRRKIPLHYHTAAIQKMTRTMNTPIKYNLWLKEPA